MSQPQIVQSALDGEDVVARVALGGEDELYATPTRTLIYRAEGLLSDETVEEYPHDAERISVSEGRRKAKVTLDYGLDGERTFGLSAKRLERALHPVVEGVLKANGILDPDEPMERLFRFSELTLVVATTRVVRHIGGALWDEDFEEYAYEDVTDLAFESGSVATSVVLTVDGRQERFKTPNDDARAVREALESSLLSYWGVSSVEELREANEPDEADAAQTEEEVSFGDGPDPLSANPAKLSDDPKNATRDGEPAETAEPAEPAEPAESTAADSGRRQSGAGPAAQVDLDGRSDENGRADAAASQATPESEAVDDAFEASGFESATPGADERVLEELADLRETVERQNEEIRAQRELVEQLIEELRRGR
jgi:hypothetical protein